MVKRTDITIYKLLVAILACLIPSTEWPGNEASPEESENKVIVHPDMFQRASCYCL